MSALEVELSMIRTCERCGAEFMPRRPSEQKKYCSRACYGNALRVFTSSQEKAEHYRDRTNLNQRYRRYVALCRKAGVDPLPRDGDWEDDHRDVFKRVHGRDQWQYPTKRERVAAERARSRVVSSKQYQMYKDLCAQLGVDRQGSRWASHLSELRRAPAVREDNRALWLATKDGYKRWWLERYSLREIHQLALGLYGDDPL